MKNRVDMEANASTGGGGVRGAKWQKAALHCIIVMQAPPLLDMHCDVICMQGKQVVQCCFGDFGDKHISFGHPLIEALGFSLQHSFFVFYLR